MQPEETRQRREDPGDARARARRYCVFCNIMAGLEPGKPLEPVHVDLAEEDPLVGIARGDPAPLPVDLVDLGARRPPLVRQEPEQDEVPGLPVADQVPAQAALLAEAQGAVQAQRGLVVVEDLAADLGQAERIEGVVDRVVEIPSSKVLHAEPASRRNSTT